MERVISGLPWLPRDKYHVAVHEPTPRGTFVRVSFRKGACVCGDLQGRYAEACRWVNLAAVNFVREAQRSESEYDGHGLHCDFLVSHEGTRPQLLNGQDKWDPPPHHP